MLEEEGALGLWSGSLSRFFRLEQQPLACAQATDPPPPHTPLLGKYGHAAHFTVRCGCLAPSPSGEGNYQTPIVALVMNFAPTGAGETHLSHSEVRTCLRAEQTTNNPVLLRTVRPGPTVALGQLETLLHEFGHALHSLLSRTKFQHLSGTRAAADFVEVGARNSALEISCSSFVGHRPFFSASPLLRSFSGLLLQHAPPYALCLSL